jgi:hypothetical protein
MRGRWKSTLLGCSLMVAPWICAQTATHPIDTKPEGSGTQCSYSGGVTGGQGSSTTTSSNTGAQATAPPLASYSQPSYMPGASQDAAPAAQTPASTSNTQQASPPTAPAARSSASAYAFPGESDVPKVNEDGTLSPAAPTAPQAPASSSSSTPGLKDAGSSGSSSSDAGSSSSSSSSSSQDGNDAATPGDGTTPGDAAPAPKRKRRKLPPVARQTPDERETEDVQVGQFYMNDNNYIAAYDRAKDAVSLTDDDWEAHLLMADAARKMGKFDEAEKQYKRTLTLDPTPKGKKAAEAALKQMGGGGEDTLLP